MVIVPTILNRFPWFRPLQKEVSPWGVAVATSTSRNSKPRGRGSICRVLWRCTDAVIFQRERLHAEAAGFPQVFLYTGNRSVFAAQKSRDERGTKIGQSPETVFRFRPILPLVVQVSRFDPWEKIRRGVIEGPFESRARAWDCTLVLVGKRPQPTIPRGDTIFESLLHSREERIIILSCQDAMLVNALQRRASVVLQKSLREGFGLTVAEAMWKGTPVIGGNVGGIRLQIQNGVNGFLVSSIEETAERIVQVLTDHTLYQKLGNKAKETVRQHFLLCGYVEHYLDLFASFETIYRLNHHAFE
jgi:glycosyltransferase involved in cell wall biosynthesis